MAEVEVSISSSINVQEDSAAARCSDEADPLLKAAKSDVLPESATVEKGKGTDQQQALQDVGNVVATSRPAVILPGKSLLKRPKSDSPNSSGQANPPKRIRIVENLDALNGNNHIQLEDDDAASLEVLEGADDLASVTEAVSCGETLKWLNSPSCSIDQESINVAFVRETLVPVKRTFSVEINMRFILTETVTAILGCKSNIAEVGAAEFHLWASRHSVHSNVPTKGISYKENFLKMANIDAMLDYDLSAPKELIKSDSPLNEDNNVYYVGDLWQNSKGFQEYMLWKTSQKEQAFSTKIFTMKTLGPFSTEDETRKKIGLIFPGGAPLNCNDDLSHLSTENVEAYGSSSGYHDILDVGNIDNFTEFVLSRTKGKGLHLFIVDNAEVSYVYESCREIRLQKYFYCQCLLALRCLREGGTFVCKIFDTFTLFTNSLLFLLYKCFEHIAIHKPSSSSSCTSERFVICKGKIDNPDSKYVVDFLSDCLDMVVNNQEQRKIVRRRIRRRLAVVKMEVQKIVPLRQILSHAEFFQYVRESNIRLTTKLAKSINELCQLISGRDENQPQGNVVADLQREYLKMLSLWCTIPLNLPIMTNHVDTFLACQGVSTTDVPGEIKDVTLDGIYPTTPCQKEFLAFPVLLRPLTRNIVFSSIQGWFFGCGGANILHRGKKEWNRLNCTEFSLPYGTVLFGEITEKVQIVGKTRKFLPTFHIMDGAFVRGTFIGSYPLQTRQTILKRLLHTLKNETYNKNAYITPSIPLSQLTQFYLGTHQIELIGCGDTVRYFSKTDEDNSMQELKNLSLVNGYLLCENFHDSSPQDFFHKSNWCKLIWDQQEEENKSYLLKLESRYSQ